MLHERAICGWAAAAVRRAWPLGTASGKLKGGAACLSEPQGGSYRYRSKSQGENKPPLIILAVSHVLASLGVCAGVLSPDSWESWVPWLLSLKLLALLLQLAPATSGTVARDVAEATAARFRGSCRYFSEHLLSSYEQLSANPRHHNG
jgi:hypothetical protein